MTDLANNCVATAAEHGDRSAPGLNDAALAYTELLDAAQRMGSLLASKGVGPVADAANEAAGSTGGKAIIIGAMGPDDLPEDRAEVVDRDDGDTALVLYTFATTGKPKGVGPDDVIMGCRPRCPGSIGLPHDDLGEEVGAAVALKSSAKATPEEFRDHVKERLTAYKYPRTIWRVNGLPKGPTGKTLRREVTAPTQ